ncbi:MAG: RuBisCO large subunit C-terminal-like domain-containing protein [Pseudomonadota bacterium]
MNTTDTQGFFAEEETLDRDEYLFFTYIFETQKDPRAAAAALAQEQSTAQWARPGKDEDFRTRFGAKVVALDVLEESKISAFGAPADAGTKFIRARVRIAHPHRNFGARIPNLLTAAMGEGAFFCHGISTIKLIDIEFPDVYLDSFQGPQFGTKGLRELLCIWDRPLFFGVVKPNIGLEPADFAKIAHEAWLGGLDVAKDDEMLADPCYCPFAERMRFVGKARRVAEDKTGESKMFIANITDEVDRLMELHDIAVGEGINAVMVNVMATGLSAVRALRKNSSVPIIAHFDCIAPMSRHPYFGVSTTVLTKLERLCGCDAIIMPGFGSRMMTPDDEVIANADVCTSSLGRIASSLPVPGGSDWAGTLPMMHEKLRTIDFGLVPGRGVFGHPLGPKAGAASLRQAWEAVVRRIDIADFAKDHPELKEAIKAFADAQTIDTTMDEAMLSWRGFTGVPLIFQRN